MNESTSSTIASPARAIVPPPGTPHLGYLDGIRGLAAFYVVLHHANFMIWNDDATTSRPMGVLGWISSSLLWGHYAVDIFIVLSGFCLMLPVIRHGGLRGGAGSFFWRRCRRILPPYYAAVGISMLLIWTIIPSHTGTHWDHAIPVSVPNLISHVLLLQDVYTPQTSYITGVNYSLWSVATEFHIYLFFPLLVWCWYRAGGLFTIALTFVLGYGSMVAFHFLPIRVMCIHYVALFGLGMGAAAITFAKDGFLSTLRTRVPWLAVLILGTIATAVLSYREGWQNLQPLLIDPVIAVAFAALLIYIRPGGTSRVCHWLEWKPFELLGAFSYSLYLIHAPLLQVLWQYGLHPLRLSNTAGFALMTLVGAPIICAAAYVFYLLFERPFMSTGQRAALPIAAPALA